MSLFTCYFVDLQRREEIEYFSIFPEYTVHVNDSIYQ